MEEEEDNPLLDDSNFRFLLHKSRVRTVQAHDAKHVQPAGKLLASMACENSKMYLKAQTVKSI